MSDPVRITNPGAESLGYDSDGHEIMAVDIYVNPPRVDVFHGTPPAWSSFGNKTIWGGNEWVDDSPTRSDIEKRDKEITAYKNTLSAQQKENENKRTEVGKRLSAAIAAREKDENTLKTLRAGNADAADITRQEFRLLQAELREYGFRTEIAGYDALRLHTGFAPIFPDICYHLTHYKPAAADIPVASDNPAHYADAIRYNARTPLQGSLLPLTRLVWA